MKSLQVLDIFRHFGYFQHTQNFELGVGSLLAPRKCLNANAKSGNQAYKSNTVVWRMCLVHTYMGDFYK